MLEDRVGEHEGSIALAADGEREFAAGGQREHQATVIDRVVPGVLGIRCEVRESKGNRVLSLAVLNRVALRGFGWHTRSPSRRRTAQFTGGIDASQGLGRIEYAAGMACVSLLLGFEPHFVLRRSAQVAPGVCTTTVCAYAIGANCATFAFRTRFADRELSGVVGFRSL